jgi:hypothetical protein
MNELPTFPQLQILNTRYSGPRSLTGAVTLISALVSRRTSLSTSRQNRSEPIFLVLTRLFVPITSHPRSLSLGLLRYPLCSPKISLPLSIGPIQSSRIIPPLSELSTIPNMSASITLIPFPPPPFPQPTKQKHHLPLPHKTPPPPLHLSFIQLLKHQPLLYIQVQSKQRFILFKIMFRNRSSA